MALWDLFPAAILGLLALLTLAVRPGARVHQLLAAVLLLRAGVVAANATLLSAQDAQTARAAASVQVWYALVLLLGMLWLALELFTPPGPSRRWLLLGAATLVAAGLVTWMRDPHAFIADVPQRDIGSGFNVTSGRLYYRLNALAAASDAVFVTLAALRVRREAGGVSRPQALALGWAFGLATVYATGYFVSRSLVDRSAFDNDPYLMRAGVTIMSGAVIVLALAALARAAGRGPLRVSLVGLVAVLSLGGLDGYAGSNPAITSQLAGYQSAQGLIRLTFTALILVAVTRYGLASAGQVMRRRAIVVAQATLVVGLAIAGTFAALRFLGSNNVGLMGVAVAIVAPTALWPLLRTPATTLTQRLFLPSDDPRAIAERARTYAAAVAASRDGGTEGEKLLAQMREDLGISLQEHELLVVGVASRDAERYQSVQTLGRGSTAQVELAIDEVAGRRVVVKRFTGLRDPAAALKEARSLAAVRHPRVVSFLEVDRRGDDLFLVLAYAEGGSARQLLDQRGPLPAGRALALTRDLLEGLEALHANGVIHCDLKPENLLIDAEGRGMLGDFGSARFVAPDVADATLTGTGAEGSLSTISPEALRGAPPSEARDVYATGALLYRLLTGEHYVALADSTVFQARERIFMDPPRLPHARIPEALAPVIEKALQKRPADRYRSAGAMLDALPRAMD